MYVDVEEKMRRKNILLYNRNSKSLEALMKAIRLSTHKTLILWSFECITPIIDNLKTRYNVDQIDNALLVAKKWAAGEVKMGVAKKAILEIHSLANAALNSVDHYYFHAIGQGLSTVHVETHAIGLVIYELSALTWIHKDADYEKVVSERIKAYIETLKTIEKNTTNYKWAPFIDKVKVNKEMLIYQKSVK